jgi:hypothetical protein
MWTVGVFWCLLYIPVSMGLAQRRTRASAPCNFLCHCIVLVHAGLIEYLDVNEESVALIAMYESQCHAALSQSRVCYATGTICWDMRHITVSCHSSTLNCRPD